MVPYGSSEHLDAEHDAKHLDESAIMGITTHAEAARVCEELARQLQRLEYDLARRELQNLRTTGNEGRHLMVVTS